MKRLFKGALCLIIALSVACCSSFFSASSGSLDEIYAEIERAAAFPHPYLNGVFSEETGECTIIGAKPTGYDIEDHYFQYDNTPNDIVIPDEIENHPVTTIASFAFYGDSDYSRFYNSVVIGDSVRVIGDHAFIEQQALQYVSFGKNVEYIGNSAFDYCPSLKEITSFGDHLTHIGDRAFSEIGSWYSQNFVVMPPLPDTVQTIGCLAFSYSDFASETFVIPSSVTEIYANAFYSSNIRQIVFLSKNATIVEIDDEAPLLSRNGILYCYSGSTAEENALIHGYTYYLIDGDSLLWDGETIAGNVLPVRFGMTEEELRSHLSVDGASSEIQIDGLQDGKVVGGTTVMLFHTVAQAPGKVYTVEKKAEPVSVSVETLPTKTNYFYKETFDPSGLSLRVAYDDGTETVVTDGIACTGTDLTVGTNTITATVENQSVTFPVTVRYSWWQTLIRIFLFGFLWY